jgi:hypothetical protein
MPANIVNPIPDWLRPENASVLDPSYVRILRTIAHLFGGDDPQSQVLALAGPLEVGPSGGVAGAIGKLAQKLKAAQTGVKAEALPSVVASEVKQHGGFTVDPRTGEIPTSGAMVGKYPNVSERTHSMPADKLTAARVKKFIDENADALSKGKTHVGGWVDQKATPPQAYLDVAERHDTVRQATKRGEMQTHPSMVRDPETGLWPTGQAQKEVYDVASGQTSPVGNVTDFVNSPEFQQRLDAMYQAGAPVMEGKPEWWSLLGGPYEEVYGPERLQQNAGLLAATSPQSDPVTNARTASEYMRRVIKGEPTIQPDFRMPADAVAFQPGLQMPFEKTRVANLERGAAGNIDDLRMDKVNDMAHALMGEDVNVVDRHFAKVAEDPARGIYASGESNVIPGAMDADPELYAWIDNALRDGAKRNGLSTKNCSATAWEGIRSTIKNTGELFGVQHRASAIPDTAGGFGDILTQLIEEKAGKLGITAQEMATRLRNGDASLLAAVLSTPVGLKAYREWSARSGDPGLGTLQ